MEGRGDHECQRRVAQCDLVRGDDDRAERADHECRADEQRPFREQRARERQTEPQDRTHARPARPLERSNSSKRANDGARMQQEHEREREPHRDRARDTGADRAQRRSTPVSEHEHPVRAATLHRQRRDGHQHDRPRPTEPFARVGQRLGQQHRGHAPADRAARRRLPSARSPGRCRPPRTPARRPRRRINGSTAIASAIQSACRR